MAIVPPGNKQIGDYTNIVVTNWTPIFYNHLTAGFVVTREVSTPIIYNHLTAGFVVTREVSTRVETLIMNLKYNTPGELTFT